MSAKNWIKSLALRTQDKNEDTAQSVNNDDLDITSPTDSNMSIPDSPPHEHDTSQASNQSAPAAASQAQNSGFSGGRGVEQKPGHGAPGSSWNSKKFMDEYNRVLHSLLDNNNDAHGGLCISCL